jgi:NAD+ synthase (glutamine-hydrolysing)
MRTIRIGLAQINPTVGDFEGNVRVILEHMKRARLLDVDLVAFPELAVTGYPPEDLLLKPQFIGESARSLDRIIEGSLGIAAVVGFACSESGLFNAAAVIHDQRLAGVYHKVHLPNYGVFDEKRYFQNGQEAQVYSIGEIGIGISICEDIWHEAGPPVVEARSGAEVLLNISASPYHFGKGGERRRMLEARASDNAAYVAYVNLVGGQDELVFDGGSMILDARGELLASGKQFEEDLIVADLDIDAAAQARLDSPRREERVVPPEQLPCKTTEIPVSDLGLSKSPLLEAKQATLGLSEEVYKALVLGTRDYVRKNGFEKITLGLSGGIDSSLVAAISVDALGVKNVVGVSMPSRYSSPDSKSDAVLLAKNLGIRLITVPIEKVFQAYLDTLSPEFKGTDTGVAEENLQARARGNILMALSNKFNWLVLTTGNKSELATGYSTLYGDMAGGFAVIKDVPKTMVYDLVWYRNSIDGWEIIPGGVLEKEPSAELRPDQRDTDSLPPYEVLDPVITAYAEEDKSVDEIISMGFDDEVVRRVAALIDGSEYKRRQSTIGIKITPRAFGRDRRLPVTNRFRS